MISKYTIRMIRRILSIQMGKARVNLIIGHKRNRENKTETQSKRRKTMKMQELRKMEAPEMKLTKRGKNRQITAIRMAKKRRKENLLKRMQKRMKMEQIITRRIQMKRCRYRLKIQLSNQTQTQPPLKKSKSAKTVNPSVEKVFAVV